MAGNTRAACLAASLMLTTPAWAQPASGEAAPETRQAVPGGQTAVQPSETAAAGVWDRANLTGTWSGLRPALVQRGISFGLTESSEVFGNPSGGVRQGMVYEGLTQFSVGLDLGRLAGIDGGTVNVSGYQIHGRGLSLNNLGNNIHTVSSLEALRGWLLFEAWYEQQIGKTLSVRVGQLAADQEFMLSQYSGLFLNHTFGWSSFPSSNLPSSGPSYPLATPGVRVRWTAREELVLLVGVFNGDPAGPGPGLPQQRDPSGTAFRLQDGVFAIAEVQVSVNAGTRASGLPGLYRAGGYYHSGSFADQRQASSGLSLADPAAAGLSPLARRGNWALYAIADQLLYREAGTKDQGLGGFLRVMGAPGDRNPVNFYVDAGLTYKGLVSRRPADTAGLAIGYARISDTAARLNADQAAYGGPFTPIRRNETVLEATYQAQLAPWWQVQPTAQYVFNPGGGVANPLKPDKRIGDAVVLGLRTTLTF